MAQIARKITLGILALLLILLLCAASLVFVFTQTDWGRERTRLLAISQLRNVIHGRFHVGKVDGDLLRGATLTDVWITDSAGTPFVRVDTVQTRYSLKALLGKRIDLTDIRLVRPVVVLDRKAGEPWNYDKIFPRDTSAPPSGPGFGSWITLRNVALVDGKVTVRAPWSPDSTLTAKQQDSVIRFVLGPLGRQNIVRVDSGFQNISEFREINGELPYIRIADADQPGQIFDANGLSLVAEPFRPPAVRVVSLAGRFTILDDSLYFRNTKVRLTGSRIVIEDGRYNLSNDDLRLRLNANPVATNDLLWIDPNIPRDGKGALNFALDWVGPNSNYQATDISLAVAGAKIGGSFGVLVNDSLTFHDTDLQFSRLDTRTIEQLFPTLASPRQGFLSGRTKVDGSLGRMTIDGDVTFDDPLSGSSRVVARGGLGTEGSAFRADNLRLTLHQIQVGLGKIFMPTLPIGGVVTGSAVLNGSTANRLTAQTDLTHTDTTGESHIVGEVAYGENGRTPFINADLQFLPLSLTTVGRFAPAAGLQGTLSGPVQLTGPLNQMVLDARLMTPDSGVVAIQGKGDFAAKEPTYDATVVASLFDASQVSEKSPKTSISADVAVRGTGLDPATMNATASARVRASQYDSVAVDSATILLSAQNGLLTVDTLAVRIPRASANVSGTFGLSDTQRGTLRYAITIDSLSALSRFIPRDTGDVVPRPAILAQRIERARADSARIARATEVERAVTGAAPPKLVVDTPQVIRRETLSGMVQAEGTMSGNIHGFDVLGTALGRNLVAMGSSAQVINARYDLRQILTPQLSVEAGVVAADILASGFALDTVVATVNHKHPNGSATVQIRQDDKRVYGVTASYAIQPDQSNIFLDDAKLQFDTTVYTTTKASLIRFGERGIDIDAFEMLGPDSSRVYVDGLIPKQGDAMVNISVTRFNVANIISLIQSDVKAQGLVSFNVRAEGTVDDPKLSGAFGAEQFAYESNPIPEIHGSLDYADKTLKADITARRAGGPPILVANGTIPIDLSLTEVKGSRVPSGREIDVSIVADSLPLDVIPEVTDAVKDLRGNAAARFTVAGTVDKPDVQGYLSLTNGAVTLIPNGVRYSDMNGYIRLIRDTIVIDSLFARGKGTVKLEGGIGIKKLSEPSFAVALNAANLRVLDNEYGQLDASANLKMSGPFNRVVIKGNAQITDGFIVIPETGGKTLIGSGDPALYSVLDTTVASNRELFPTESPLLANLQVDVSLGVDRDVFVRTREANIELYTEDDIRVTLDQATETIRLDGMLLSDRGEYRFQGKRFIVKRGTALFTNTTEIDPTLQITAEYDVQFSTREAIAIQIVIGGTLSRPKISLTSDAQPPISQTDLLSYLAFGQSSSSLLQFGGNGLTTGGSGGSNIVGQGATFAAKQVSAAALSAVTDEVAWEIGRSVGADVLNIAPAPVSLDAASVLRGTEVQFGKYISNRTFVSLQMRPDPASLKRPGFQITHRFSLRRGYRAEASFEPRYLQKEPTLNTNQAPVTTSVFGLFFIREWRF
jgi:autotransporter translocation and assembly factor TamB